ncbi:MAG: hypothetical protein ACTHPD_11380, partial [Rhizomicrobium sp.]
MSARNSVTFEKKLRAGTSLWAHSGKRWAERGLLDSIRADVVIVGAGVSGAFMARALAGKFENV